MLTDYRQAVERHRQRIFSFARYSLRAREDAEDVTQEVFLKLWQHWNRIDHTKQGAWLMRVAHNSVVDHVRKHGPLRKQTDDYTDVTEVADSGDVVARLDKESFSKRLVEAIGGLKDPFRSIVIMRDVQGMTYAEIRESLQISDSQVKVYLHRGRRKLREDGSLRRLYDASRPRAGTSARSGELDRQAGLESGQGQT